VRLDDQGSFISVDGEYRVKNVKVGGVPLDPAKTYTLASHNYMLKNGGDGFSMFKDNKLLQDEVMLDNQVLITYIVEELKGVVGDDYKNIYGQGRIKVVPFADLVPTAWYSDSVMYVYTNGIMNGMSLSAFKPDSDLTHSMFITMLYRLAGSPETESDEVTWYSDAVIWAADNGIIPDNVSFKPASALTREEMAGYLYRYIRSTGGGFEGAWMFNLEYTDKAAISEEYLEAVSYLTMNNVFTGSSFNPDSIASRAMGAAVLQRFAAIQAATVAK
jgi:hypothetical protein